MEVEVCSAWVEYVCKWRSGAWSGVCVADEFLVLSNLLDRYCIK